MRPEDATTPRGKPIWTRLPNRPRRGHPPQLRNSIGMGYIARKPLCWKPAPAQQFVLAALNRIVTTEERTAFGVPLRVSAQKIGTLRLTNKRRPCVQHQTQVHLMLRSHKTPCSRIVGTRQDHYAKPGTRGRTAHLRAFVSFQAEAVRSTL